MADAQPTQQLELPKTIGGINTQLSVGRKPVSFKTKDGREVKFEASGTRKTLAEKRAKYDARIIANHEKGKRKADRELKRSLKAEQGAKRQKLNNGSVSKRNVKAKSLTQ